MIIKFKIFENNNLQPRFKKGDLVISESYHTKEFYVVLDDVHLKDERANAFFIGYVDKDKQKQDYTFSFNINTDILKNLKNHTVRNFQLRTLTDSDRKLIIDEIYSTNNKNYSIDEKLKKIEEYSGFNLKELPELIDYQIRTSAEIYNI